MGFHLTWPEQMRATEERSMGLIAEGATKGEPSSSAAFNAAAAAMVPVASAIAVWCCVV